jgi:hypothetical protein
VAWRRDHVTEMHIEGASLRAVVVGSADPETVAGKRGGERRRGRRLVLRAPDIFAWGVLANVLICLLGSYLLARNGVNRWVDGSSVTLLWLLGLENIGMLFLARRTNDPFVAILVGLTTIFYMGRVDSLLFDPYSIAFTFAGFPVSSDHVNATLRLVFWGNLAVFLGVTAAKARRVVPREDRWTRMTSRLVIALAIVFAANFLFEVTLGALGRVGASLLQVIMSTHMVLLMAMTFLLLNRRQLAWLHRVTLASMLALFVALTVIIGSRSGLLVLLILGLCALLAPQKRLEVRWSWLAWAIVVPPLAITLFSVASLVRLEGYQPGVSVSTQRVRAALAFDAFDYGSSRILLRPVLDRVGFLDYATVMVAGAEHYAPVISVEYYFKSLVDNLLSPGFDVYDAPRTSQTIRFLPRGDVPSHARAAEEYNSSQLTAYGELFVLFRGFWPFAIAALGFMGYIFARLFARIRTEDEYHCYLYRGVVLLAFHNWLNSFGLDWMAVELRNWIATLLFFEWFVVRGGAKRYWRAGASAPVAGSGQSRRMGPRTGSGPTPTIPSST